jgi:hypothetical protein
LSDRFDTFRRSHNYKTIFGLDTELRVWSWVSISLPDHRHDRNSGSGSDAGVADSPVYPW